MLRLLFLFLILRCAAVTSDDTEDNYSGDKDDQEEDEDVGTRMILPPENAELDKSKGEEGETKSDATMIIIIAAASVVALAVVAVVAIVFVRRYLRSKEQGVYSMPAEQGQKAAV